MARPIWVLRASALMLAATVTAGVVAQQPQSQPQPQVPVPSAAAAVQAGDTRPIHVYIRAGLKSHGEGLHDYPQFAADWSKLLTDKGALVDGSFHFPSAQELASTDVMVMYKGDAGYMTATEKAVIEDYVKRGGGFVLFHDTLCGDDPAYMASIVGGAKKHGEVNYTLEADVPYTIADTANPIMAGMSNFTIKDEAFFLMTWAKSPAIKVLATATMAPTPSAKGHEGEVVPQVWTYERTFAGGTKPYRAFVWMQGHNYENFALPNVQSMLLRAIAWTGKRPVDTLMTVRPQRGGGRGTGPAAGAGEGRGGRGGE